VRSAFEAAGAEIAGLNVGATVSIGAATAHELPCDLLALLVRADAALYRAKQGGRNRLEADEDSAAPVAAVTLPVPANRGDDEPRQVAAVPAGASA
jgi:predicted signal transduction protein with EAL and GGDEF domain